MRRLVLGFPVVLWLGGCASAPDATEQTASSASHLEENAEQAFEKELNEAFDGYDSCVAQGKCESGAERPALGEDDGTPGETATDGDAPGSGITTQRLRVRGLFGGKTSICDVLTPLAGLEHAFFFVGASASVGAVATAQGGVDLVWDLWNLQAAAFAYGGGGLTSLAGVDAAVYSGYGFGNKSDVIDAWSGRFNTISLSVGFPVLNLSAGASGFGSPDMSIVGGAVGLSIGLNWIPSPVNGGLVAGVWTPFDTATKALDDRLFLTGSTQVTNAKSNVYLQFPSGVRLGSSILQIVPSAMGTSAAAQAVALDVLKSQGVSVSQLCNVKPPAAAGPTSSSGSGAAPTPKGPCELDRDACLAASACVWSDADPNDDTHTSGGCSERTTPAVSCSSIDDSDKCTATSGCRWYLDLNDDTLSTAFCVDEGDPRR